MPCKGIAYCNRVQRLFLKFSPSIKVDQPQKATGNPFSLFTDRNQKLMPDDTGPKTNPLQLLFDRYETILLCWQIGNATKDNCQIALASLEKVESFTSEHHFIPRFTTAEKVQLWLFLPARIRSTPYSLMWVRKQAIIIWWMRMR